MEEAQKEVYKMIDKVYREKYNHLVNGAHRRLGNHSDAEDTVQEAFTRACEYWYTYDKELSTMWTWLNTILNRTISDRKKDIRLKGMAVEVHSPEDLMTMNPAEARIELKKIEGVINAYPHKERVALKAYAFFGCRPADIELFTDYNKQEINYIIRKFNKQVKAL